MQKEASDRDERRGTALKIYKNITELIGRTPLLEVTNIEQDKQLKARSPDKAGILSIRRAA